MAYNPYIPWNDEMVVVLLNLVVTEGVHIAKKSEIAKKWNAVNDLFFEQNELLLYKSAYRGLNCHRMSCTDPRCHAVVQRS